MDQRFLSCPCCNFPTLSERGVYEICTVCWWEDDGQNEDSADHVWGGPNGPYSLAKACANFQKHGHMYDVGEGIEVVENPSQERVNLLSYVVSADNGNDLDQETLLNLMNLERQAR